MRHRAGGSHSIDDGSGLVRSESIEMKSWIRTMMSKLKRTDNFEVPES